MDSSAYFALRDGFGGDGLHREQGSSPIYLTVALPNPGAVFLQRPTRQRAVLALQLVGFAPAVLTDACLNARNLNQGGVNGHEHAATAILGNQN